MEYLAYLSSLAKEYIDSSKELVPAATFEELGMDSYDVVDFLVQVEEHFNIYIPNDKMLELKSIQDVLDMIDKCSQEEI